jgi:hypothetical protein
VSPALLQINSVHADVQKLGRRRSQRRGAGLRRSGRGRVSQTCDSIVDVIILILYSIITVKLGSAHDICTFTSKIHTHCLSLPLREFVCVCVCLRLSGCVYERGGGERGMCVCVCACV